MKGRGFRYIVLPDRDGAVKQAASTLEALLEARAGKPTLILLSGGSSLWPLQYLPASVFGPSFAVTFLDDRFTEDPTANNFLQLTAMPLFTELQKAGVAILPTNPKRGESLTAYADRLDGQLRLWLDAHSDARAVALIGVGTDGHTAGIMRYPDDEPYFDKTFVDTDRWVVGYDATGRNPYALRATATIPFIRDCVDHAVCVAVGSEKVPSMQRLFSEHGSLADTPSRVLWNMRDVVMFTDIDIPAVISEQ